MSRTTRLSTAEAHAYATVTAAYEGRDLDDATPWELRAPVAHVIARMIDELVDFRASPLGALRRLAPAGAETETETEPTLADALARITDDLIGCAAHFNARDDERAKALSDYAAAAHMVRKLIALDEAEQPVVPRALFEQQTVDLEGLRAAAVDVCASASDLPADYFEGDRLGPLRRDLEALARLVGMDGDA